MHRNALKMSIITSSLSSEEWNLKNKMSNSIIIADLQMSGRQFSNGLKFIIQSRELP